MQLSVLHHNENCQRQWRAKADGSLWASVRRVKASNMQLRYSHTKEQPTYSRFLSNISLPFHHYSIRLQKENTMCTLIVDYINRLFTELHKHVEGSTKPALNDPVVLTRAEKAAENA
jgi:hypothetical protein